MKDEDYLETKEFKNALKADQFHEEVAKKCGPMIEEIASKHYFIDDVAEETRTNN